MRIGFPFTLVCKYIYIICVNNIVAKPGRVGIILCGALEIWSVKRCGSVGKNGKLINLVGKIRKS